jgi:hypothetical protein
MTGDMEYGEWVDCSTVRAPSWSMSSLAVVRPCPERLRLPRGLDENCSEGETMPVSCEISLSETIFPEKDSLWCKGGSIEDGVAEGCRLSASPTYHESP